MTAQALATRLSRAVGWRLRDAADRARGRDPLIPPRRLDFVGDSDFTATGDEFLGHFVELAGLRPDEHVLDVGSGIGRMARPLAGFLSPRGSYHGFDAVAEAVDWCRRHYSAHPNFAFAHVDVANALYNPRGREDARTLRFPHEDGAFDFVFLTSVLTHLLPDAADHYLGEVARVTRPGGRVLLTFFLLDEDARARRARGEAELHFDHERSPAALVSAELPEQAVAYEEAWVHDRLAAHGLRVREPVHRGCWSGRAGARSFQDIVVVDRP